MESGGAVLMTTPSPHWPYTTLTLSRRKQILRQWIVDHGNVKKGSRRAAQRMRWIKELKSYD